MKRAIAKQLRTLGVEPDGLCSFLAKETDYGKVCDHTFKHTRILLADYRHMPAEQIEQVISVLQNAGAVCDCEVGFNICGA